MSKQPTSKNTFSFRSLKTALCLLIYALLSFVFASIVEADWTNLGLYGGRIYEIAIHPTSPNIMFAGASYGGGLFKTDTAGTSWDPVTTGEEGGEFEGVKTFRNTSVYAVKISPSNPNIIWVAHDYYVAKSTDGGQNWEHYDFQQNCANCGGADDDFRKCKSISIDPNNPNIVYVGTSGPDGSNLNGAIYKTTNGGVTWTKFGLSGTFNFFNLYPAVLDHEFYGSADNIAIHPTDSNILWALDYNHGLPIGQPDPLYERVGLLYLSTDAGQTWNLDIGVQSYIAEKGLVVKPNEPHVLFIGSLGGNDFGGVIRVVYPKNPDGSVNWNGAPSWSTRLPIGTQNVRALAFDPQNSNILYAASGWWNSGFKLLKSINGGDSFTEYTQAEQFISLAPHPTNPSIIFGGGRTMGIYQGTYSSGQNSYTWIEAKHGINSIKINDIAVDPNDSSHLLAATMAGVFEKQGDSPWSVTGTRLPYDEAFSVAFKPSDTTGSTFYAGAESYLYKTADGGESWDNSRYLGFPYFVTDITLVPNSSTLYFTTDVPGKVYKCLDSETTFCDPVEILKEINPVDSNSFFNTVAVDGNNSNHIYSGGGNFLTSSDLYRSIDGGVNWDIVLPNVRVNKILIDSSANPSIIYAGCGAIGYDNKIPLYKSTDGGTTWEKSYEGIPGGPTRYGIWGSSENDVFVLRHTGSIPKGGFDDNYIPHYGGSSAGWSKKVVGVSTPLYDIWGISGSNVFAVGEAGTVVHYDGISFAAQSIGTSADLHSVWGNAANNVYAVGDSGTVLKYNGINWSSMTSGTTRDLRAVWGDGVNVFAVGAYGAILKYTNATDWVKMTSNSTADLNDIWGSAANNIFAVGSATKEGDSRYYTVLHYNGSDWSRMTIPEAVPVGKSGKLLGVWGGSGNNVWAVGDDGITLHYDGTEWSSSITSGIVERLYAVWGSSYNNVYAVGLFGTIIRYNGSAWSPVTVAGSGSGFIANENITAWNAVTDLAFSADGKLYASTERQGIYASSNDARNWVNMSAPPYATYAVSAGSVIVGGDAGAYSMDGEGLLYGIVRDGATGLPLQDAKVTSDFGKSFVTNFQGEWLMHHPAGWFDLTASKPGYGPNIEPNVEVRDAIFTYADFDLNVNNPPTQIALSNNSVKEGMPAGTTVGIFTTTDPDIGDSHAYALVAGSGSSDNPLFSISGNTLKTSAIFDYKTRSSYNIRVQTQDSSGAIYQKAFLVNVLCNDLDGDGLCDCFETNTGIYISPENTGTNPNSPDTDGDGMPDGWEVLYGLNPLVNDAAADYDNDGFSNLSEYHKGTLPNDKSSHPSRGMPWLPLLLGD